MWFLQYDNEGKVEQIINLDFLERPSSPGIELQEIPQPESTHGKDAIMYVNLTDQSVFFKYVDRPMTQEEELEDLKRQQALMQTAIDDLIFGGML